MDCLDKAKKRQRLLEQNNIALKNVEAKEHKNFFQKLFGKKPKKALVYGYGHIIGLSESEQINVKKYLANPNLRAPCKSDNCVAWTSSIELGKTELNATPEERNFLFTELGMSRSMAHFEIGRRLANASNERHAAMFIFVEGADSVLKVAENPNEYLPIDPKIPYTSIIKDFGLSKDSDVMKALDIVPNNAKVFIPIAAGASPEAVTALIQKASTLQDGVDVHMLVNGVSEATLQNAAKLEGDKFRIHSLFLGANQRVLYNQGKVKLHPGYLSDLAIRN